MPSIKLFYIFLVALFAVLILIPPISNLAVKIGILDKCGGRKVHKNSTPRIGGVAIFFAFLIAWLIFGELDQQARGFLVGGIIVFLVGLADDLVGLSPVRKLSCQIVAVLAAVLIGNICIVSLGNLFGGGDITLGIFTVPFTVLAIVGVINAVNLLDGLDGLAAGVCAIAAIAMGILAYQADNQRLFILVMALLGSVIGFLRYNSPPATIFMGDGGSLFLGYCMGFLSVMLVTESKGMIPEATPLIILAVPVVDTCFVIWTRLMAGKSPFAPDNNHIHHRFLALGVGHKLAVIMVYAFTYILAIMAVTCRHLPNWKLLVCLAVVYPLVYFALKQLSLLIGEKRQRMIRKNLSLRDARLCRRLVELSGHLRESVKYLLVAVIFLSACTPSSPGSETSAICLFLLGLSAALLFMTHDLGNRFLLFILYFDGAFIIYQMENMGRKASFSEIPFLTISHLIFLLLLIIAGIIVFIRRKSAEMASSPLEYLIFFIVITVPLLPGQFLGQHHLMSVAGKSVILFAGYKLILMRHAKRNRKIIVATLFALLVVALKGIL